MPGPCGVRSGSPVGWHDPDGSGRGSGGGPGSWEGQGPRSKNVPPRSGGRVVGGAEPLDRVALMCGGEMRVGRVIAGWSVNRPTAGRPMACAGQRVADRHGVARGRTVQLLALAGDDGTVRV